MPISREAAGKPDPESRDGASGRPAPGSAGADFGEKGPKVEDDQAGLTEDEKLEEAVEDLSAEKG